MLNPFDMVVVVILGFCMISGAFRGIIREAAAISGVLGGFYAAFVFYDRLAPVFSGFIENPHYRYVAAFLLLFFGVFAAAMLLGMLIRAMVQLMLLGVVDRICGALFGAVKGVIIAALIFVLLSAFLPDTSKGVVGDSALAPHINTVAFGIMRVIPEEARSAFVERIREMKRKWEDTRADPGNTDPPDYGRIFALSGICRTVNPNKGHVAVKCDFRQPVRVKPSHIPGIIPGCGRA